MTLGLLLAAALGLLALVAGPVLAHLARRQPTQKTPYGAMLLLERLVKRLRRRRRLRDLILMLLRMLLVALVVLAVARPEARWPGAVPEVGAQGAVVVVLDNSLSMDLRRGEGTLLSEARDGAVALLRSLPDGVRVGAVTIGGDAARLTTALTTERDRVAAAVESVGQTQGGTDLAGGLRLARQLLAGGGGEVVVFLDEAGPSAVPAAREELALLAAQGASLSPRVVQSDAPANVAVLDAVYGDGPEGGTVRVTVASFGDAPAEVPCTIRLPDGAAITAFIEVPAGGQAEELFTVPRVAEGGVATAEIEDGHLAADDTFAFQLPRIGASRVLVVDGDPGPTPVASEVYFLERALAPWGAAGSARGGLLPDVIASAGVADLDPEVHRVVFLANVADPGALAPRLVDFVRRGGGLVIGMGDNVTADRYNGPLATLLPAPLRSARALATLGEPGKAMALPDTSLALFQPFARGGRAAFGAPAFRRVMTLEPYQDSATPGDGVHTLATLEGGLPVVVERRLGQGRVVVFLGTFDLEWGSFPLQAAYMPFVQRLVSYLGGESGGGGERLSARVGETVSVALPDSALDVIVTGPSGPVSAPATSGAVSFTPTPAGAYVVETPGAPPRAHVAVNVDPAESDVTPGPALIELAAEIDPERFTRKLPLGPFALGAALLLALGVALAARGGVDEPGPPQPGAGRG